MPTVAPPAKVLVTGANGFIAFWLIRNLLEKGYSVRGTVRSIKRSGDYIKDYFESYGDKFELVEVPDITKPGAFDEAIQGVDAVEHTASPVDFTVEEPEDFIVPAVNGTLSILGSALKHGSNLKRVVLLSSAAAISGSVPPATPHTYTESNWNDGQIKEVETLGKAAGAYAMYGASKTLAERAAWEFVAEHKGEIRWDFSALQPPYVFGPVIHQPLPSPSAISGTPQIWYNNLISPGPQSKDAASASSPWVDVRDFADVLILALEKEAAGGERIMVASASSIWQEWSNAIASLDPPPFPSQKIPVGFPDIVPAPTMILDTSKEAKLIGFKFRTIEETARDILADFAARGW